jgi:ribosomal protein L13E
MRPRLLPEQLRDLALAHAVNLDAIAKGEAGSDIMWQMIGGVFTWHRVAEVLGRGVDEMQVQHDVAMRVLARHARTGRVGYSGTEHQQAKAGIDVMDALAELVDSRRAVAAAEWAEAKVRRLEALHNEACAAT